MPVVCTLFSVTEEDVRAPADVTLSPMNERTSKVGVMREPHVVELGTAWGPLHEALGAYPGDHPLGFLVAGGASFEQLEIGEHSSGRYYDPARTVKLLAAVARVTDDRIIRTVAAKQLTTLGIGELTRKLTKVRVFLAEAVEGERGIIVHRMG